MEELKERNLQNVELRFLPFIHDPLRLVGVYEIRVRKKFSIQ